MNAFFTAAVEMEPERVLEIYSGRWKIETQPWRDPSGPPSIGRLRRVFYKARRISPRFHSDPKPGEIPPLKDAA